MTAHLHFNGVEGLVLVKVSTENLDVKWKNPAAVSFSPIFIMTLSLALLQT